MTDEATRVAKIWQPPALEAPWEPLPLVPECDRRSDVAPCAHMLVDE
jgi:hypothetical protein